jgi:hypothetical protein
MPLSRNASSPTVGKPEKYFDEAAIHAASLRIQISILKNDQLPSTFL